MFTDPLQEHQANPYVINPGQGAEMARLLDQDRLLMQALGLFPEPLPSSARRAHPRRILDIGCGPGGWVQEVALAYRQLEIVGIDKNLAMIEYARAQAQVQKLFHASFQVMDATGPLHFPDRSFTLVNIRLMGFLPTTSWTQLMRECARITLPGGMICLTDFVHPGLTTSPSLSALISLLSQALKQAGQSFSPDGSWLGIAPLLGLFLCEAGCIDSKRQVHTLDFSAGTDLHAAGLDNAMIFFKLVQPFLVKSGVITQAEVDRLYDRLLLEMQLPDFCAIQVFMRMWGKKPEQK